MRVAIVAGAASHQRRQHERAGLLDLQTGQQTCWGRIVEVAIIVALLGTVAMSPSEAEPLSLTAAWQAASDNDPDLLASRHELEAGLQSKPIARAGLLPKVSAVASAAQVKGDRTLPDFSGRSVTQSLDYTSRQMALQLRQPIYNREAITRYQLGVVQADYARAIFDTAVQDLAIRLSSAYFELLFAKDVIDLAAAQITAYEGQARRATGSFARGEGTRTEISDAESRAALARADLIGARDSFAIAQQKLASMVGSVPTSLPALVSEWVPRPLEPEALDGWLSMARDHSPQIEAQRLAFEAAKRNVARSRAGHHPTLDLVASVGESESDSTSTLNQTIRQNSVGVQLNVPLYAGGGVSALTQQALANQAREAARLEATINKVLLDVRQNWLITTNAWAKIEAYKVAVDAALTLQRGVDVGIRAGLNVPADALNATRLLYVARRDLASARYEYLLARLKLSAATGVLSEADIQAADNMLQ